MLFREAKHSDFDDVLRLYRQLHPEDPIPHDESAASVFTRILNAPDLYLLVLEIDGFVAATAYLNVILNLTRSASPYAVIENVVVDAALRGTGLGKQIMAHTLRVAWDAGCYKAMVQISSRNPAAHAHADAHAFYKACGFTSNTQTAYLAWPS